MPTDPPTSPTPPRLDYASPMPHEPRIRCEVRPDGVALTVAPPARGRLVREAVLPAAVLAPLGLGLLAAAGWAGYAALTRPAGGWPVRGAVAGLLLWAGGLWLFVALARDAWQNAGIVTRIKVAGGRLAWTKQTLWGYRTVRWPAADVTAVTVWTVGGPALRVARRRGTTLNAFAGHRTEDLLWAASVLRDALALAGRRRRSRVAGLAAPNEAPAVRDTAGVGYRGGSRHGND